MPVSRADLESLQALQAAGSFNEAEALVTKLLHEHSDTVSACLIRGSICLSEGQGRQAHSLFLQAAAIAHADPRCHLGIAQSLAQLGLHQRAIASSQEVLRLDPDCWQARLVVADSLSAMGLWSRTIERYRSILDMGVTSALVHLGLGIALQKIGRLTESKAQFYRVIQLEPHSAAGYCNLGNTLLKLGELSVAIEMYQRSLRLTSDTALIYANLANAFLVSLDFKSTEENSRQALKLSPNFSAAHGYLAEALRLQGRFAEAIPHYNLHGTPEASAKALECHFILGAWDEFEAGLKEQSRSDANNIRMATISTFAALQQGPKYLSQFCAAPLEYVAVQNLSSDLEPFDEFAEELLREITPLELVWEPPLKSTKGGSQTEGNIFDLATPGIATLQRIIRKCIAEYFDKYPGSTDRYVTQWPKQLALRGWIVCLRRAGQQEAHIHTDGWLSGVFYLRLPPGMPAEEGGIEFTLAACDYPAGDAVIPTLQYQPQVGDLILFPSSLFHRTVPFSADAERISIAFDLLPRRK